PGGAPAGPGGLRGGPRRQDEDGAGDEELVDADLGHERYSVAGPADHDRESLPAGWCNRNGVEWRNVRWAHAEMGRLRRFLGELLQPFIRGRTIIRRSRGRGPGRRSSGKDRLTTSLTHLTCREEFTMSHRLLACAWVVLATLPLAAQER